MSEFAFAHVSDLHLPFEPVLSLPQHFTKRQLSAWSWQRRRALHRIDILDALAQDIRTHAVDHILVTGDITNFALPDEFEQAARWLTALAPPERISLVPGNHDALVPVPFAQGLGIWQEWTRADDGWPFVHRRNGVALIGLNSALPTPPLLARGWLGAQQLSRLEQVLAAEGKAGRIRIVMLHHPPADGAVGWRKALADRHGLRAVLQRVGAELVLHGHARDARMDVVAGPALPIPCLCVPSSSAVPNPKDQGALWHRLRLMNGANGPQIMVEVRRWSAEAENFVPDGAYALSLPRVWPGDSGENIGR
ncbi:metallophosphoesterase [Ramlibacter sp. H39-3-26]|uniref:metallophosphoesterase family protein n=1 Tax=Curvibacter soli TaxID=3031331 RepID=UPI0023DB5722|nr:metallophosphoesterase [Ramlibacter sp. H39-3-26]MDF1483844.1 metallophosphoesterase [Ramlibacter sp. H39-3-26]